MDININLFIVLLIYLFLFNENKIIKRLLLIYVILFILSNLYKCFFKKIIEGADTIGEPIDYNKNIYNILNDNILLLQDVNALKQYEKKLKDDITNIQNNLKTNIDTLKENIDKKHNIGDDINFKSNNYINNKGYISVTDNGLSLDFKAPESNKIFKLKDIPTNPNDIATKSYVDNFVRKWKKRGPPSSELKIAFDDYELCLFSYNNLRLRKTNGSTGAVSGSATNTYNGVNTLNFYYNIDTTFSSDFVINSKSFYFGDNAKTLIIHFNDTDNLYKIIISMWTTQYFIISVTKI